MNSKKAAASIGIGLIPLAALTYLVTKNPVPKVVKPVAPITKPLTGYTELSSNPADYPKGPLRDFFTNLSKPKKVQRYHFMANAQQYYYYIMGTSEVLPSLANFAVDTGATLWAGTGTYTFTTPGGGGDAVISGLIDLGSSPPPVIEVYAKSVTNQIPGQAYRFYTSNTANGSDWISVASYSPPSMGPSGIRVPTGSPVTARYWLVVTDIGSGPNVTNTLNQFVLYTTGPIIIGAPTNSSSSSSSSSGIPPYGVGSSIRHPRIRRHHISFDAHKAFLKRLVNVPENK
jgi:hypothetical protein